MDPNKSKIAKEVVSFDRFTALLNEELRRRPWYRSGMDFVIVPGRTGYDFVGADDLHKSSMAKEVHDCIMEKYDIAR